MERLLLYTCRISVLFIWICILIPILGIFIPLEFSSKGYSDIYDRVRIYGIPLAILLTLTRTIKKSDKTWPVFGKIFGTIVVSGLAVFVMTLFVFFNMCGWSDPKILFENKNKSDILIIERSYGCGAWDSSFPTRKTFKVRPITPFFNWVTEVDLSKINKTEWKEITW